MIKFLNLELFDVTTSEPLQGNGANKSTYTTTDFKIREDLRPPVVDPSKPHKKAMPIARLYRSDYGDPIEDYNEYNSVVRSYQTTNKYVHLCNIHSHPDIKDSEDMDIFIVAIPTRGLVGRVVLDNDIPIEIKNCRYYKTIVYDLNDMTRFTGVLYMIIKVAPGPDYEEYRTNYNYTIPVVQYSSKLRKKRVTNLVLPFDGDPYVEICPDEDMAESETIPDITGTQLVEIACDPDNRINPEDHFQKQPRQNYKINSKSQNIRKTK